MGRYYSDQTGREGKFWLAVQPSDDPKTVFKMNEMEPDGEEDDGYGENYIDYEGCDAEGVKKVLDEQYEKLGVPKEKRKYKCENEAEYIWEELKEYFLTDKPVKDAKGHMAIGYYMGDDKPTLYPISYEKELAASRIDLGLFIYNSILENGHCFMTAEL